MKVFVGAVIFFIGLQQAIAQEAASTVRFMLSAGSEVRSSKDVHRHYSEQALSNFAIGTGYQNFLFTLEKSQHDEFSGNSSLNVSSAYQNYLLWAQWRGIQKWKLAPYMGAGVGAYQQTVETNLMGSVSSNSSDYKFLSGVSLGLSADIPYLWLSIETRLLFGDELDPQPTLSGLARIGIWF